jgi:hypothetical protein
MWINIDKTGLLTLVKSAYPNYDLMEEYAKLKYGYYAEQGGWFWNKSIEMLDEETLKDIYETCVDSWKK